MNNLPVVVVHIFTSEIVSSINYQARMFGDAYWSAADNPACTSKYFDCSQRT